MSIIENYGTARHGHDHKELEERVKHVVCRQCGGPLTTALIVYDVYGGAGEDLYCPNCKKQEFGVEKEIYDLAEYYVTNFQFNYFYDMEENDLNGQLNIAKVTDMIAWILKNIDLLDKTGLKNVAPNYEKIKSRR
ncbi:MAG: hypothetical protein ACLUKQ_02625 [Peptococcaceae bacterium]